MKQFICILAFFFASNIEAKWVQVWSDEFNGNKLDSNNWIFEEGCAGFGNNELECYTVNRRENARVENGHLVIQARVEKYQVDVPRDFTSARLLGKKGFTYGRFEARARMPKGKHLWPAIWMMPLFSEYGMWAASGEIDIMEYRGDRPNEIQGTIHYGGHWPNNVWHGSGEKKFNFDFSADYHVFAFEWEKNTMRWYVDNQLYHTENINKMMWSGKGNNPYTKNGQPFDIPFRFILNIAISGNFFPANIYGPAVTPAEAKNWAKNTMEIDYIKVYRWE